MEADRRLSGARRARIDADPEETSVGVRSGCSVMKNGNHRVAKPKLAGQGEMGRIQIHVFFEMFKLILTKFFFFERHIETLLIA